jgi:hypothetical protein
MSKPCERRVIGETTDTDIKEALLGKQKNREGFV